MKTKLQTLIYHARGAAQRMAGRVHVGTPAEKAFREACELMFAKGWASFRAMPAESRCALWSAFREAHRANRELCRAFRF